MHFSIFFGLAHTDALHATTGMKRLVDILLWPLFLRKDNPGNVVSMMMFVTADLYLNVGIAYEVYDFVKKTSWICRTNPPSLCKVTIQAIPVYCFAILLAVLGHFLGDIAPGYIYFSLSFIKSVGIPVGLVLFVCVMIWRCGLMSSCPNSRMKVISSESFSVSSQYGFQEWHSSCFRNHYTYKILLVISTELECYFVPPSQLYRPVSL